MMTWGREYWPVYLIVCSFVLLLGFGVPEAFALIIRPLHVDNTLSFYARSELNVSLTATKHTMAWWLTFISWMMFTVFITAHIWFDQFG